MTHGFDYRPAAETAAILLCAEGIVALAAFIGISLLVMGVWP